MGGSIIHHTLDQILTDTTEPDYMRLPPAPTGTKFICDRSSDKS